MNVAGTRRSVLQKLHDRVRYGLALQEFLDLLARRFSLVVLPYYVVLETLQSPSGNPADLPDSWEIRYLDERDMQLVSALRTRPRGVGDLHRLLQVSHCLGAFIDGRLAGYSWSRYDRASLPVRGQGLFKLEGDEVYLFDAFVAPGFRGQRLMNILRSRQYAELTKIGKTRFYSITRAFNASSRRFKARLGAREVERRLLLGTTRWWAIDLRLRALDSGVRGPGFKWLGPVPRIEQNDATPTDADGR